MDHASDVIMSGSSAGGLAVFLHIDQVAGEYCNTFAIPAPGHDRYCNLLNTYFYAYVLRCALTFNYHIWLSGPDIIRNGAITKPRIVGVPDAGK